MIKSVSRNLNYEFHFFASSSRSMTREKGSQKYVKMWFVKLPVSWHILQNMVLNVNGLRMCSNVKWQQVERGRRVDISTHDFSPFSLPNETFDDPKQKFLCHRMPENHVDIERQWTRYVIGSEIIEWKLSPSNPQANIIAIKWEKVLKIFIWADTWHFHTESIAIQKHRSVKRVYNCEWMDYEGLLLLVWIIKEKWKLESLEITSHNRILEGFDLKSYKECRGFQRVIKCLIYHKVLTFCHGNVIKEMKLVRKVSR